MKHSAFLSVLKAYYVHIQTHSGFEFKHSLEKNVRYRAQTIMGWTIRKVIGARGGGGILSLQDLLIFLVTRSGIIFLYPPPPPLLSVLMVRP